MTTTHSPARHSSSHPSGRESAAAESRLIGVLGQFDDPSGLIAAAEQAREAGYRQVDAYSPFPVHGIDEALGIRRSRLPFFVLAIGIGGCFFGLFMQWYANRASFSPIFPGYDFIISGKPLWSLPANIPVTFEVIVLSSAFAAFFGMLFLNRLPRLANPLHRIPRFRRATNDRFFLVIDRDDAQFEVARVERDLAAWGATGVEQVHEDLTDHQFPSWMKSAAVLVGLLLLLPPVMIYRAHFATNTQPRLHVIPDMDNQYRYKPQTLGPNWLVNRQPQYFFGDKRAMREPLPGTVARGELQNDSEYFLGIRATPAGSAQAIPAAGAATERRPAGPQASPAAFELASLQDVPAPAVPEPDWVTEFPARVTVDEAMMQRGRERFQIYCTVCHGYAGDGDGLVNQRAMELAVSNVIEKGTTANATWTQAKSFHDPAITVQPVGRIFDTISHGRGTMGPYGRQIPTEDRWAIVLYVKALQATRAHEPKPEPAAGELPAAEPAANESAPTPDGGGEATPPAPAGDPPNAAGV